MPLWAVLVVLGAAFVTSEVAGSAEPPCSWPRREVRVGVQILGVAAVIYATGLGPVLVVGFLAPIADLMEDFGTPIVPSVTAWSAIGLAAGQAAVATGFAPSVLRPSLAHGVATLGGLGLVVGITFLWRVERRKEEAEATLRASEERFRALVQHTSDLLSIIDPDGTVRYASPSMNRLLGQAEDSTIGTNGMDWVHPEDLTLAAKLLERLVQEPGKSLRCELRLRHATVGWRYFEVIGTNLLHVPDIAGIVANARDITERKGFEKQLLDQSLRDPLTGLPNRALFVDRLDRALARLDREAGSVAVLFLDLDRFKIVNDSLGHEAGNKLLVDVARRIENCLRPGDTVARVGGDEFLVLVDRISDPTGAVAVADRVAQAFRAPFSLLGRDLFVAASIGIAVPRPGQGPEDLLRDADVAMYVAKDRGRARYELFDADMSGPTLRRLETETELRRALGANQLRVHYQPMVELDSGRVVGLEALVRWEHPSRGLLAPVDFLNIAEETGLIAPVGRWVLAEACRQLRAWQLHYPRAKDLVVSVNLSGRQLAHHALVEDVDRILQGTGLPPGSLVLEITETVVLTDTHASLETLGTLRALGVRLAIDDFGTGYSSFGNLRMFPVDTLKLDKSFVDGLGDHLEGDVAIVETVVRLAHTLGMQVVAEGVEEEGQLEELRRTGCDVMQGFHFSVPLPAASVEAMLAAGWQASANGAKQVARSRLR